jgi:hypothetical protein
MEVIDTIFSKLKNNLEFTGLDFKQFFLLMTGLDYIYIYGKELNGYVTREEFNKLLSDGVIRGDFLDNIDDCYIDREEVEEKNPVTDHWLK